MKRVEKILHHFKSGLVTYVKVLKEAIGSEFELEPGMIAQVESHRRTFMGMEEIKISVSPKLQKVNKPLEVFDFYNGQGKAVLNYLQSARVKEGQTLYTTVFDCDNLQDCTPLIELYEPSEYFTRYLQSETDLSYASYLENLLKEKNG